MKDYNRPYLVFAYDQYYPTGPFDLKAAFATREQAEFHADILKPKYDHVEVLCVDNVPGE